MANSSFPPTQRRHYAEHHLHQEQTIASFSETRTRVGHGSRRRRRRRRKFRYRREAKCLLVSILSFMVAFCLVTAISISNEVGNKTKTEQHSASLHYLVLATKIGITIVTLTFAAAAITRRRCCFLWMSTHKKALLQSLGALFVNFRDATRFRWRGETREGTVPYGSQEFVEEPSRTYTARTLTISESLELFNREREARGEQIVSAESIVAYELFLRDLASSAVVATMTSGDLRSHPGRNRNVGVVTKEQLEDLCPRWTFDSGTEARNLGFLEEGVGPRGLSQTECGICLEVFEEESIDYPVETEARNRIDPGCKGALPILRTLPCQHVFHSNCIDRWLLERSTMCPTCKQSII
jgi:hypothetical protein